MPQQVCLPNAVTLGTGATGAYTDIDEGVSTHNGDVDYIELVGRGSTVTIDFVNPSGTAPYNVVQDGGVRGVVRQSSTGSSFLILVEVLVNGVVTTFHTTTPNFFYSIVGDAISSSTQAQANSVQLRITVYDQSATPSAAAIRITAADATFYWTGSGSGSGNESIPFSDTVVFSETWVVQGGTTNTITEGGETAQFGDSWGVTKSGGGGGPDIVPGDSNDPPARTDTACRSCGSMAQVTESLIFYADGFASPVTWNGVSATATTVSGAKLLPYVAAHRDRVWLFGEEPYVTGTVQTVSGITTITFSTAPATTVLGKNIAISDVSFGTTEHCQATIIALNGVQATLSAAPNQNFTAANFIIFSGTSGASLQWSDENDHTSWTAAVLPVGRLDGDIPTGVHSVSGFLMVFKRAKTYRFDYGTDPNDANDRALVVNSETRGLVAHRCCVVVEGTAYCMDQFGSGAGEAGWWITRGGALFPIEIGGDISPVTSEGSTYELDWSKSSCWFGVYEPNTNSVWWFCTKQGDNLPTVAFVYNRPSVEGGDQVGRWTINEFDHPCIMGVTAVGHDGVMRAYIACADPNNEDSLYLAALSNKYGDMATSSQNGVVKKKISNTVLDLGKHTELYGGSLVEINGEKRTVESDDTVQVTFTSSWALTNVEKQKWKAGWKPKATFKTIYISPEPASTLTTIDQAHCLFIRANSNAELRVGFDSDGNTTWMPVLGGAVDSQGTFGNYERLVSMSIGIVGYEISLILELLSPGGVGDDMIHAMDIMRRKRLYPSSDLPSEMP